MDDTWVVVADGSRARIFATDAEMTELKPVHEMKNANHAGDHRGHGNRGPDSGHKAEEGAFATELAQHLGQANNQHKFRDLVLVAPPRFLGDLRGHLAKPLADKVSGSVSKDLVAEEVHALAKHLRKALSDSHETH